MMSSRKVAVRGMVTRLVSPPLYSFSPGTPLGLSMRNPPDATTALTFDMGSGCGADRSSVARRSSDGGAGRARALWAGVGENFEFGVQGFRVRFKV